MPLQHLLSKICDKTVNADWHCLLVSSRATVIDRLPLYLLTTNTPLYACSVYTYCLPLERFRSYTVTSRASDEHPVVPRPWPGGEKRIGGRASHHEQRCSDRVVAPPMCDHMIILHRWVVFDGYNPARSAVDAATHARRAERDVGGGVVSVLQALHGSLSAPRMHAQHVAQFAPYHTRNCLPRKKLRRDIQ